MLIVLLRFIPLKVWKSVSGELLEYLEEAREGLDLQKKKETLLAFFKTCYTAYKQGYGGTRPWFNFADLLEMSPVKAVLEDKITRTLPDTFLPELKRELMVEMGGRA